MRTDSTFASAFAAAAVIGAPLLGVAAPALAQEPVAFTMWTKEGTDSGAFQFVQKLADEYHTANPNVTITVVNKGVENLRTEFLTTSLAGQAPELLWTVADHVGPFTAADVILPLDGVIDTSGYLPNAVAAVQADGKTRGVPISFGNHLMLYTNKALVPDCPADSDALAAAAKANTSNGNYGLAMAQTESFWLVPFLGAFHGSVFAADGTTATLDTPEMVSALTYLHGLKFTDQVMPGDADPATADGMFKNGAPNAPAAPSSLAPSATPPPTGTAAMIVNGDWTLGAYKDLFGDQLNVCPIPKIVGADYPEPYAAGTFFLLSKAVANDAAKQAAVTDFVKFATDKANQLDMVQTLTRLPALNEALSDPIVTGDTFLAGSAEALKHAIPQPTNLEMRCIFDAMTTGVKANYKSADADPQAIATQMQTDYDNDANCQ